VTLVLRIFGNHREIVVACPSSNVENYVIIKKNGTHLKIFWGLKTDENTVIGNARSNA
jgi:hypothetical protein